MDEGERKDFISRIGTFFFLIGIATMWLFVASDMQDTPAFIFFFVSIISFVLGWYFKRITAPPKKDPGRFSFLRKLIQKSREKKQKKK
jgi:hypothetical protein